MKGKGPGRRSFPWYTILDQQLDQGNPPFLVLMLRVCSLWLASVPRLRQQVPRSWSSTSPLPLTKRQGDRGSSARVLCDTWRTIFPPELRLNDQLNSEQTLWRVDMFARALDLICSCPSRENSSQLSEVRIDLPLLLHSKSFLDSKFAHTGLQGRWTYFLLQSKKYLWNNTSRRLTCWYACWILRVE